MANNIDITLTDELTPDAEMTMYPLKEAIVAGLNILKQMGEFLPHDDENWVAIAEDQAWTEITSYEIK